MKKTLVSALTTALVVGAASTTFAAANPFSDVPADHWAYDAIAQLTKDGVIEGYGDGTYAGDEHITRYEMAQMAARAMAKTDLSKADKATVDKLAAEFADELNSLGVRVAALEKKVDNVKWDGMVRFRFGNQHARNAVKHTNQTLLRMNLTAKMNENWVGKARIEYGKNPNAKSAENDKQADVDRIWAEGTYGKTKIRLGKFNYKTADNGNFLDYRLSGAQVDFGKEVRVAVTAGRVNFDNLGTYDEAVTTGSYQAIEVYNNRANKFTWSAAYHHVGDVDAAVYAEDEISAVALGLGYKFDKNVKATAAFSHNSEGEVDSKQRRSWNVQVDYKGATKKKGSWGAFVAYREIGEYSVLRNTANTDNPLLPYGYKGFEVGAKYAIFNNVVLTGRYFYGDAFDGADAATTDAHALMGQVEMFF